MMKNYNVFTAEMIFQSNLYVTGLKNSSEHFDIYTPGTKYIGGI